ncbi:MAG: lamin tail domain-containing protein, partial [Phycisphaeraceae bacterium]|nr:lamin tail domain-containing protein [Phycisphaeraceae bacterium]
MKKNVVAALLLVCFGVSPMAMAQVYINEIMAVNQSYGTDPQGDAEDWVELANSGSVSVNLGGYYLSDDPDNPQKWQFPTNQPGLTRLPARGHLVVWADSDTQAQGLHAGFNLSSQGETLVLSSPSGD